MKKVNLRDVAADPWFSPNHGSEDLLVLVVADHPIGESCYYPDSQKWMVRFPQRRVIRSEPLAYFDGEE